MTEQQPAPTPPAAPAKKPKKPRRGLNKVVCVPMVIFLIVLAAVVLLGTLFVAGPVAKSMIEERGSQAWGAKITMDSLRLNPFQGSLEIGNLQVADPHNPQQNLFQAQTVRARVDYLPLFAGRLVVSEALVEKPAAKLARSEDGAVNITPPEKKPKDVSDSEWEKAKERARQDAKNRDWVAEAKKLMEKLEERKKQQAEEKAKAGEKKKVVKQPSRFGRGEVFVFPAPPRQPRVLVAKAEVRGMEIKLEDRAQQKPLPGLRDVNVTLTNLAVTPGAGVEPLTATLDAQVGDDPQAKLAADFLMDLRAGQPQGSGHLDLQAKRFPLAAWAPLYADSWPVTFRSGVFELNAKFEMKGEQVDGRADAVIADVGIDEKPGHKKVLGLPPKELDRVLQSAGTMAIPEFTVTGPYYAPKTTLVESLAKALKAKGADIAEAYVRGRAQEEAKKAVEKGKKELEKKLEKKLGGDAGKAIGDLLGGKKQDSGAEQPKDGGDEKKDKKKDPLKDLKKLF